MKLTTFTWRLRFALCLMAMALVLAGCKKSVERVEATNISSTVDTVVIPTNAPQLSVLSTEPVRTLPARTTAVPGRLLWNEDATVRVFTPFAGRVRTILADVNQVVTNGMPLAEILSGDFGQALAEARKAESDLRRAERAWNRLLDLSGHGAAAQKDLESAEADFQSAKAEKDRAHARLAVYGATEFSSGNSFLLPSPLEGKVVEKNVTPGQEVRPDQMLANMPQFTAPLFIITDPTKLWIQIDATELDLPYFRTGCEFSFASRAFPGQVFTGMVSTISEFIDPATRTVKIRGAVDNSQHLLKAEMFVSVNLPSGGGAGASVPASAVFLSGDKHFVFVKEGPGTFCRKEVRVRSEQDGQIPILAGVNPGQEAVSEGCILLQQVLK